MSTTTFEPRWASTPADTINRALRHRNWSVDDLSDRLGVGDPETRRILNGDRPIDTHLAELLARVLGGSSDFWIARESQFLDSTRALSEEEFAQTLPLKQMVKLGWIEPTTSWRAQARRALDFFDAETPSEGSARLEGTLREARYRASASFDSDAVTLATWMRQVERVASTRAVSHWDPNKLASQVPHLRTLTRIADPAEFLPLVQASLADAGVVLVVLRPLDGMRVSGVAFRSTAEKPTIALTARHLTDDHLWFTLFHEIGHLMLHREGGVFVDEFEAGQDSSHLEDEANSFAAQALLPFGTSELASSRANGPTMREVARFASRQLIAPGIVVGQLQHRAALRANQLNGLKRRYRWSGTDLERRA